MMSQRIIHISASKICPILILAGTLHFSSVIAQQVKSSIPIEAAHASHAEKIYLQLDNTTYNTSEAIWFKAIVTDAVHHLPSKVSGVLYVELIEPKHQKIVDRKVLKLKNGRAHNSFQLYPSYAPGRYQIRAYTEWNRNFGTDFIFVKYITVFQFADSKIPGEAIKNFQVTKENDETFRIQTTVFPLQLDSLHKGKSTVYMDWGSSRDSITLRTSRDGRAFLDHTVPKNAQMVNYVVKTDNNEYSKSIVLDKEYAEVRFFPEGGELVQGLSSVVAFKALDYEGKGKKVSGDIIDEQGNTIAKFTSNPRGMGKILLIPEASKLYFGRIQSKNGLAYTYPLPQIQERGTVMTVNQDNVHFRVKLISNRYLNDSLSVQIRHRGKPIYLMRIKLKRGMSQYVFQKSILPAGISELTLYDQNGNPLCERLIYIEKPKKRLQISAKANDYVFGQRDSVQIEIKSSYNGKPQRANLSIMAIDSSYFKDTHISRSTILSYFLLESELRGTVENPAYYFTEKANPEDLEVLLLTQGWRRYKYDEPRKPTYIQPEKSLRISGYVGGVQNKKRRNKELKLAMMVLGDQVDVRQTTVDSTGRFEFHVNESYGQGRDVVFQTTNLAGKKRSVPVRLDKRKELEVSYDVRKNIAPVDSILEGRVQRIISEVKASDPFELLPNTIELDEVILSDYKITPERQEIMDLHGLPEVVMENAELMKKVKNWTYGLYSLLLFNYGSELSVSRVGANASFLYTCRECQFQKKFGRLEANASFLYANVHGADFTYVLVDGIPVKVYNYSLIQSIPVSEVKSVEILKTITANRYCDEVFQTTCFGGPPSPAILAIYTYAGKGLVGALRTNQGIVKDKIPEFSPQREFYAPDHSTISATDWNMPDLRKLIHWQPNVDTDENGKATVHFFNADATGKMLVIIEAMAPDGKLGYQEMVYGVMEAEIP